MKISIIDITIKCWWKYQKQLIKMSTFEKVIICQQKYRCWEKYQTLHIYKFWQKCKYWQKGQFDTTINNIPPPPPPPPIWWFWQLVFAVPKRNSDFYHLLQLIKVKVKTSLNVKPRGQARDWIEKIKFAWVKMNINLSML